MPQKGAAAWDVDGLAVAVLVVATALMGAASAKTPRATAPERARRHLGMAGRFCELFMMLPLSPRPHLVVRLVPSRRPNGSSG